MSLAFAVFRETSRLKSLLEPFSIIDDPREAGRMVHPLGEALFLAVCGSMAGCDHDEAVATWGEANLGSLRRCLPLRARRTQRTPADLLKNRIDPALFSAAFAAWVRATRKERPDLVAIDGKTSRRGHNRADDKAPPHRVSAFATASRLALGQEAVEGKGADWLLAVKANQPTLRAEIESACAEAATAKASTEADAPSTALRAVPLPGRVYKAKRFHYNAESLS